MSVLMLPRRIPHIKLQECMRLKGFLKEILAQIGTYTYFLSCEQHDEKILPLMVVRSEQTIFTSCSFSSDVRLRAGILNAGKMLCYCRFPIDE